MCVDIYNAETEKRELTGLMEAMKTYQLNSGIVITKDTFEERKVGDNGKMYHINIIPIWFWLLTLKY